MRRLTLILPFDIAIYAALPKAHDALEGMAIPLPDPETRQVRRNQGIKLRHL